MNPVHELKVPRLRFGLTMAAAVAVGLLATGLAARFFGGGPSVIAAACTAMAVASLISFGPALFSIGGDHWGLAVLLCGVTRGLAVLAICYLLVSNNANLAARPLYMGAAAGAIVILIVESVLAVTILAELERRRVQLKPH